MAEVLENKKDNAQQRFFFEGQFGHVICLIILIVALDAASALPGFKDGAFLGVATTGWVVLAVANAILHQLYVWLCWRAELQGQHMTRMLGDNAFFIYAAIFFLLLVLRPVLAFALGWANRGTLAIDPWLGYAVSLLLFAPAVYLMYSTARYFGFARAAGIDHFDPTFRDTVLVRQGIFRWTPNAMYVFGFFVMWIPAFLFQSVAALVVAAFSHAYIWVHYYCTEKPDMRRIYGS